ncbi:MAG: MarR family winged helix-turn-helix transcriptional regulator [Thermoplasmataceae archaeon]
MDQKDEFRETVESGDAPPVQDDLWKVFSSVARNGRRIFSQELEKMDMKVMEMRVLHYLHKEGPSTMTSLSADLDVTGPWITGLVDELEKRNFVTKERSSKDRRVVNVALTEEGEAAVHKGYMVYTEIQNMLFDELSPEEFRQFVSIMKKLENYLNKSLRK